MRAHVAIALALLLIGPGACKKPDKRAASESAEPSPVADVRPSESPGVTPALPERVVINRVALRVDDPADRPPVELLTTELGKQIGNQLSQSGYFASAAQPAPDGYRLRDATLELRIAYDLVTSETTKRQAVVVAIESQVVWDDMAEEDPAPGENVMAERPLTRAERKHPAGAIPTHVTDTLSQVSLGLIAKEQVRAGEDVDLIKGLQSSDVDMVLWCLDLIAHRKARGLFDQVADKLASEEPMIRNRALTALVALGDRRAVDLLAKRASFDDLEFMVMVVEAVSALGGDDARDYLEFIASGHSEDDIKQRAKQGLERLGKPEQEVP